MHAVLLGLWSGRHEELEATLSAQVVGAIYNRRRRGKKRGENKYKEKKEKRYKLIQEQQPAGKRRKKC